MPKLVWPLRQCGDLPNHMQGLALEEQLVEEVPMDDLDLPLDAVVTPSTVILKDK